MELDTLLNKIPCLYGVFVVSLQQGTKVIVIEV